MCNDGWEQGPLYSEYVPNDSGALETVLRQEEWKRMKRILFAGYSSP